MIIERLWSKLAKRNALIAGIFVGICVISAAAGFLGHVRELKGEIENVVDGRRELLRKFVRLNEGRVLVMRNIIQTHYAGEHGEILPLLERSDDPRHGYTRFLPAEISASGYLTARPSIALTPAIRREMGAAISLDPQIDSALQSDKDVAWLYYLSRRGFLYVAPRGDLARFPFDQGLYRRQSWREATDEARPADDIVITGPLPGDAASGPLLSFALPVYAGDELLGVTGVDLKVEALRSLVDVGVTPGESVIADATRRILFREHGDGRPVDTADIPRGRPHWTADRHGNFWLSREVVADDLWLFHRVPRSELYWTAARLSAGPTLVLLLLALSAFTAWRLRVALAMTRRLTTIDPLTNVLNRRGFYEKAELVRVIGRREGSGFALLLFDIDHFKQVNDTYGHLVGDHVLQQIGRHLTSACRSTDVVCRWGGEEFVILLMIHDPGEAIPAAERIRQMAQRTRIEADGSAIRLSGGLALLGEDEPIDQAIRRADKLLYAAKNGRRDRIVAEAEAFGLAAQQL